jgi:hypothetical protein
VYSSSALKRSKKHARVNQSGYDVHSLKLVSTHFVGRVVGTTLGWCFNDFLFYGNKLFASTFIKVIDPSASGNVTTTWLWNLVNVGVGMVGYYLAALLIDHKFYGRKRMQIVGFLADGILFLIPASELRSHMQLCSKLTILNSLVHPALVQKSHQGLPGDLLPLVLLPAIRP